MGVVTSTVSPVVSSTVLSTLLVARFLPLSLFANDEAGVWYDPSDLTTLFQDAAGTTPVTASGQPVGLMLDKSGNDNHATQPTASKRPTYTDGSGLAWLSLDGVDDAMTVAAIDFTGTDKMSMFAGARKLTDIRSVMMITGNADKVGLRIEHSGTIFGGGNGSYKSMLRRSSGVNSGDFSTYASPTDFLGDVSSVLTATGDLRVSGNDAAGLMVDGLVPTPNGANTTGTTVAPLNFGSQVITLGGGSDGSQQFKGNLYGMVIRGALSTGTEINDIESYLAGRTGVVL